MLAGGVAPAEPARAVRDPAWVALARVVVPGRVGTVAWESEPV